ncbi:MAG: hypothetical protein DCC55_30735, partial [Chloroflexi bacterium]
MKSRASTLNPTHTATPAAIHSRQPFFQKQTQKGAAAAVSSLQHKLVTSRPGDAYEREADRMADVVTGRASGAEREQGLALHPRITPLIQRQAVEDEEAVQAQAEKDEEEEPVQAQTEEKEEEPVQAETKKEEEPVQAQVEQEEEEPVQAQVEEEEGEEPVQAQTEEKEEEPVQAEREKEEEPVQAQADGAVAPASPVEVQEQLRARRGRGAPLPDGVRQQMELRFGADFSGVRIHTDDPAIQLTRLLKANAFTQGNDIFFNQGRFAPSTRAGDHLLAHELTHTIQQGAAGVRNIQPQTEPGPVQRQEEDEGTILVRPELLAAIKLARGEIGKVNAKQTNADKTRLGWERLAEYFFTAFGEKEVIHRDVIKYIQKAKDSKGELKDTLPSWCGIFVWWAYKKAGIPIPDWKLGASIMAWVTPRKAGELPRKGDIAYREKNQHFALVTGVESPETAAGKEFKSILVATINGNTSGEDNLGGQVEEKWEPIGKWLGFFDPVAKLDMPPVPLVKTGVEPEPSAAPDTTGEAATAPEAVVETPPTDVSHLEEPVTSEPETPAAVETDVPVEQPEPPAVGAEPEVELPPEQAPPPAEEVAKVEPLPLEGASDKAMVTFTEASPSQMAATQPGLGVALDSKIKQEKQDEVDNAPVLVAQTSGAVEEGLTPPDQIPVPSDTTIGDGVTGAEPGDLTATPHENFGAAPSNEASERELDKRDEGGFLSWLRDNIKGFLSQIRTKDTGVNTSAGARPNVQLEGEAAPERMDHQRTEAQTQLVGQRDAATTAFKNHPGQQNIQPKQIDEKKPVELSPETAVSIETQPDAGVADYANAPLPAEVRQQADELLKPNLQTNLSEA